MYLTVRGRSTQYFTFTNPNSSWTMDIQTQLTNFDMYISEGVVTSPNRFYNDLAFVEMPPNVPITLNRAVLPWNNFTMAIVTIDGYDDMTNSYVD